MALNILVAALGLRGVISSSTGPTLYEIPSRFSRNLCLATFEVVQTGQPSRSMTFMIDSGLDSSVLFPKGGANNLKTRKARLAAASRPQGLELGEIEFQAVSRRQISVDTVHLMGLLGVDGALGVDFLTTHDVLLDYRQRKIFVSGPVSEQSPTTPSITSSLGGRSGHLNPAGLKTHEISLTLQNGRFFASVAVMQPEQNYTLLMLDTGSVESILSPDIGTKLKSTGSRVRLVRFQGSTGV